MHFSFNEKGPPYKNCKLLYHLISKIVVEVDVDVDVVDFRLKNYEKWISCNQAPLKKPTENHENCNQWAGISISQWLLWIIQ